MGKSSVIYVIGLSLLISFYLLQVRSTVTDSLTNSIDHHARTATHNVAVAGANIGTHRALMYNDSGSTFSGTFRGVTYRVTVDSVNVAGDREVTSIAELSYEGLFGSAVLRDTVIATLRRTPFAKYAYFSGMEVNGYMSPTSNSTSGGSMWKVTGDSLFGYAHTNTRWNLGGRPYFESKLTAFNPPNTMLYGGVYDPIFNGGTQWGITVDRPAGNLTRIASLASSSSPVALYDGEDVALNFFADGRVAVKIPAATGATRNDTVPVSSIAPDGVMGVTNADLRVKGTYRGQFTLLALKGSASTKGNIWIDGDLKANTSPRGNPSSSDMLGLVAERMMYLTMKDPLTGVLIPRTSSSVITIEAAIYCHEGVFAVEDYDSVPVSGRIDLFGSLTMAASTATGRISGGSLTNGCLKSIRHDPRYLVSSPPEFPVSNSFELIAWWEN